MKWCAEQQGCDARTEHFGRCWHSDEQSSKEGPPSIINTPRRSPVPILLPDYPRSHINWKRGSVPLWPSLMRGPWVLAIPVIGIISIGRRCCMGRKLIMHLTCQRILLRPSKWVKPSLWGSSSPQSQWELALPSCSCPNPNPERASMMTNHAANRANRASPDPHRAHL